MTKKETCSRCNGTGFLEEFGHIDGGRCFKCGGYGQIEIEITESGKRKQMFVIYVDNKELDLRGEHYQKAYSIEDVKKDNPQSDNPKISKLIMTLEEWNFFKEEN